MRAYPCESKQITEKEQASQSKMPALMMFTAQSHFRPYGDGSDRFIFQTVYIAPMAKACLPIPKDTENPRSFSLYGVGSGLLITKGMFHPHFQNGLHMIVRHRIQKILSLPAEFDQMHLL